MQVEAATLICLGVGCLQISLFTFFCLALNLYFLFYDWNSQLIILIFIFFFHYFFFFWYMSINFIIFSEVKMTLIMLFILQFDFVLATQWQNAVIYSATSYFKRRSYWISFGGFAHSALLVTAWTYESIDQHLQWQFVIGLTRATAALSNDPTGWMPF